MSGTIGIHVEYAIRNSYLCNLRAAGQSPLGRNKLFTRNTKKVEETGKHGGIMKMVIPGQGEGRVMGAKYKTRSDSKSGTYLFLAGGVALLAVAVILYIVYREPPAPELLKMKAASYFRSIADKKVYEAYDLESISGKVPLARYEEAIGKQFDFARKPLIKNIYTEPAVVTGNDATVKWRIDMYYVDTERAEMKEGVMKFHFYDNGWRKEPDEALQKILDGQKTTETKEE